jgi:hypothetical protein
LKKERKSTKPIHISRPWKEDLSPLLMKTHLHLQAMEEEYVPPLPDEERAQNPFALPGISTANLKSDLGDVQIRMHRKKNRASDPC